MSEKVLVTNFAYGTGPYLRTTELALAFNDELEARGRPRLPVVVPWVYGEKQRRIMLEEFGDHARRHPDELLLDPALGQLLRGVFYTGAKRYAETLGRWVETAEEISRAARAHLSGTLEVETLQGARTTIDGKRIALELNRSPRIRYDVAPAYSTTFGYVADILERAAALPAGIVDVDPALLVRGVALADSIEGKQDLHCMAFPATFSWDPSEGDRYGGTLVPPITDLPRDRQESLDREGLFVTVTGIEGLERLYGEARQLGLALYSNDPEAVPGSVKALPSVVGDEHIRLQFARAGWGSLWLSMFRGTPVLVPPYDPTDDPEIYFNNQALSRLGFGVVYQGQPLGEILAATGACRERAAQLCQQILARWGTLNGNQVCARMFVQAFVQSA
jgi:hypothetical protein